MGELERGVVFLLILASQCSDILYPARLLNTAEHRVSPISHDVQLLHLRMGSDPRFEKQHHVFRDEDASDSQAE